MTLKQIAFWFAIASASLTAVAQTTTTYDNLDDASGWQSCTKPCAGGNGTAKYRMTEGVASPSQDGAAAQFWLGGSTGYSNALWWLHVANDTKAANFTFDMYQYIDKPAVPQAIEYAVTQYYNGAWYKFSTQCSYSKAIWRVWDSYDRTWVATTAPCKRQATNTWSHLTFQYQRANGRAVFVSITVDGQTWYINKSFRPYATSGTNGNVTVHYQLDGNNTQTSFNAYLDELSLTTW